MCQVTCQYTSSSGALLNHGLLVIRHALARRCILGEAEVDCGVDAVGFEARGCGADASKTEQPASVLNALMSNVRAGGAIGIPGLYVTDDPGAADAAAKAGALSLRLGLGWAKSISFGTGQCPVIKYRPHP